MGHLLARPLVILLVLVVLLGVGWLSYENIGSGFMPSMDEADSFSLPLGAGDLASTKMKRRYQLKPTVMPIPPWLGTIGKIISELGFSLSRCK